MKTQINIAEILKKCPSGMELDCALYDNVVFDTISDGHIYPIKIKTPEHSIFLTKDGCYSDNKFSKCVIFPKGKTTWEGFVPPCEFKDVVCVATNVFLTSITSTCVALLMIVTNFIKIGNIWNG